MTLSHYLPPEIIARTSKATNMVEVEVNLSNITAHYLNEYAGIVKPPSTYEGSEVRNIWVNDAITFFNSQILSDKLAIINAIPERMYITLMYKEIIAKYK